MNLGIVNGRDFGIQKNQCMNNLDIAFALWRLLEDIDRLIESNALSEYYLPERINEIAKRRHLYLETDGYILKRKKDTDE